MKEDATEGRCDLAPSSLHVASYVTEDCAV
jgi:hypothetical protein